MTPRERPPILSHNALLTTHFPPARQIVAGILNGGEGGFLAGPPGTGKTWAALALALAVASGTPWGGHFPTKQGTVLIIDEESHLPGLQDRVRMMEAAEPLGSDLPIYYAVGHGIRFDRADDWTYLAGLLDAHHPDLVIVDSFTRVHGANENSAGEMADVFSNIKQLMRDHGCAFLIVDHLRKKGLINDSEEMLRGSSEKRAWPEVILFAQPDEHRNLRMSHIKSRYSKRLDDWTFRLDVDSDAGTASVQFDGAALPPDHANRSDIMAAIAQVTDQLGPDGADVATIAGYLEVNPTTAKRHLDKLLAIGMVWTRSARTAGRTKTVYGLAREPP